MSDQLNNMKEALIYEFLYKTDFKPGHWDIKSLKHGLRRLLGEEPAINVGWLQTQRLNEASGEFERADVPTSVTVHYTTETVVRGRVVQVPGNVTVMI